MWPEFKGKKVMKVHISKILNVAKTRQPMKVKVEYTFKNINYISLSLEFIGDVKLIKLSLDSRTSRLRPTCTTSVR